MDFISFASSDYFIFLGALIVGRGADLLSTWVATPNLVLEANPLARKLGWKWGSIVTAGVCGGAALWPLLAIIITTISLLVAARNFQYAWLMRSLGEEAYRAWMADRVRNASAGLLLLCLLGEAGLIASVGVALISFSDSRLIPLAVGAGIVSYAVAVVFYTLITLWRLRYRATTQAVSDQIEKRSVLRQD
jgi:hypothetical protein